MAYLSLFLGFSTALEREPSSKGYLQTWFCTTQEMCDGNRIYVEGNYEGELLNRSQIEVKQL
jgi:hypothetical protein